MKQSSGSDMKFDRFPPKSDGHNEDSLKTSHGVLERIVCEGPHPPSDSVVRLGRNPNTLRDFIGPLHWVSVAIDGIVRLSLIVDRSLNKYPGRDERVVRVDRRCSLMAYTRTWLLWEVHVYFMLFFFFLFPSFRFPNDKKKKKKYYRGMEALS